MICNICPKQCSLSLNEIGKCNARVNTNNVNTPIDLVSSISIEPIEKKLFFHFLPNTQTLSIGFFGCQLSCPWCQNFTISHGMANRTQYKPLDYTIIEKHLPSVGSISFSFNEPLMQYERIIEISNKYDKPILIVTNGYVNKNILNGIEADAYNICIKGDDNYYKNKLSGDLQTVLSSIENVVNQGVHLELSYIIVPEILYNTRFHRYIRDFIKNINRIIPIHLLYCYPCHKLTESYNVDELIPIWNLFKEVNDYTYISNVYSVEFKPFRQKVNFI